MDIQTRKIEFIQEFLKLEDDTLIGKLEALLGELKATPTPLSVNELNARIDQSLQDSANEKIISLEDLKAEMKTW